MTLGDFARLNEGIGDVGRKFAAAYRGPRGRKAIGATNNVDFPTRAIERPTELNQIGETLGVIVVHVGEEYRVQLLRAEPKLIALWYRDRHRTGASPLRTRWRHRHSARACRRPPDRGTHAVRRGCQSTPRRGMALHQRSIRLSSTKRQQIAQSLR